MIYITGDTHGEQARFLYSPEERRWTKNDVIIVCGDFGFIFNNSYSERCFLDDLEKRPYTVCFVDGNHENFPAIYSYPVEEWNGGKTHRIRTNIFHLMRGQIFTIQNHTFFTFGGAYSIDRFCRERNVSFWDEEIPTDAEYKEAIENLKSHNMSVDYILTHNAPKEIVLRIGYNPDVHDWELVGFLEYLMYNVEHRHWYCGHWHMDKDVTDKFTVLWFNTVAII